MSTATLKKYQQQEEKDEWTESMAKGVFRIVYNVHICTYKWSVFLTVHLLLSLISNLIKLNDFGCSFVFHC